MKKICLICLLQVSMLTACTTNTANNDTAFIEPISTEVVATIPIEQSPTQSVPLPEETPLTEYPMLDESQYETIEIADGFIWCDSPEMLETPVIASLKRGAALFDEFFGEEVAAAILGDEVIPIEEELVPLQGSWNDYVKFTNEALSDYIPDAYLQNPESNDTCWDSDSKTVYDKPKDQPRNSLFLFIYYKQVYENGIPFDGQEKIEVLIMADLVDSIDFSLHDFEPVSDAMVSPLAIGEVFSMIDKSWKLELQYGQYNDESLILWRASLAYSNVTNLDNTVQESGNPEIYDLHWIIESSQRTYYINCVNRTLWSS